MSDQRRARAADRQLKRRRDTVRMATARLKERLKARLTRLKRHGGKQALRETSQQVKAIGDRFEAMDMKAKGLSFRQIGQRLGCSHVRARELVLTAAAEVELEMPRLVSAVRAIEGATCDEVKRTMIPLMHGQIPAGQVVRVGRNKTVRMGTQPNDPVEVARVQTVAAQRVLGASQRIAALYGADAPIKVAPTDPGGTRRYHDLTTEELQRLVAQKQEAWLGVRPLRLLGGEGDGRGGGDGDGDGGGG